MSLFLIISFISLDIFNNLISFVFAINWQEYPIVSAILAGINFFERSDNQHYSPSLVMFLE